MDSFVWTCGVDGENGVNDVEVSGLNVDIEVVLFVPVALVPLLTLTDTILCEGTNTGISDSFGDIWENLEVNVGADGVNDGVSRLNFFLSETGVLRLVLGAEDMDVSDSVIAFFATGEGMVLDILEVIWVVVLEDDKLVAEVAVLGAEFSRLDDTVVEADSTPLEEPLPLGCSWLKEQPLLAHLQNPWIWILRQGMFFAQSNWPIFIVRTIVIKMEMGKKLVKQIK